MNKATRNALIGAAAWSVGIYVYQRVRGVIIVNGQTLIPGFLDPLGMLFGYPNQVQVTIGTPTTNYDQPQLEAPS